MPSSDEHTYPDELLTRYLLGDRPADQSERVDELSVTDEELACRLDRIENELVDAYVAEQLKGDTLKQFETRYLASDRRRQRVEFAEALRCFQRTPAPARAAGIILKPGWFSFPRPALQWGLAAAVLGLLFVSGYLLLQIGGLRREVEQ